MKPVTQHLIATLITLCALPAMGEEESTSALRAAIEKLAAIQTIDADLHIETRQGGLVRQYTGRYKAAGTNFRLDIATPKAQSIVSRDGDLKWYFPGSKMLWTANSGAPETATAHSPLPTFQPAAIRPFLDKHGKVDVQKLKRLWGLLGETWSYSVELQDGPYSRFVADLDAPTQRISRLSLYDMTGKLASVQELTDYLEFSGAKIFPGRVRTTLWTPSGIVESTAVYQKVRIDRTIPDTEFALTIPEGTRSVPLGSHKLAE